MHALKITENDIQSKSAQQYNVRVCLKHFHLSVLNIDSNNEIKLQLGAYPTLCMLTFAVNNDLCKENKVLLRLVTTLAEIERLSRSTPLQNAESTHDSNNIKDNVFLLAKEQIDPKKKRNHGRRRKSSQIKVH